MDSRQAYQVKRDPKAPLHSRLAAHAYALRDGMPGAGDSAKLEELTAAVADLCAWAAARVST